MKELFEKLLILRSPFIGPLWYDKIIAKYGSPDAAVDSLEFSIKHRDAVRREMDLASKLKISYVCDDDMHYPKELRTMQEHPPVLMARGNLDALCSNAVSIVGTSYAGRDGMRTVCNIAYQIASRDTIVVSGMAAGIDRAAHIGALATKGDKQTVAVLGGGIDCIWPPENEKLYYAILERGAIVSEMPLGAAPRRSDFIRRNKWIAAMGTDLILGEADLASGSMTTVRFAIGYGRPVWAVPVAPGTPGADGPNSLIATGAAHPYPGIENFLATQRKSR